MRIQAFFLSLICLLLTIGCDSSSDLVTTNSTTGQAVWSAPDPNLLSAEIQDDIDEVLEANRVPGALVGVFTPQGQLKLATGTADISTGRKATFEDSSAWRSITKSFTVTVILQLAAEGLIDLDRPISDHLQGVPNGDLITPRQLADMTSGLADYSRVSEFITLLIEDLTQTFTTDQLLSFAFAEEVNFDPGQEYEYSNTNTLVLERLAEEVTGTSLAVLIQARILNPLGMRSTVYLTDSVLPGPFLRGYSYDDELGIFEEFVTNGTAFGGAGAMVGTPDDLAVWGKALVSGALLPPAFQQQRFVGRKPTNGPKYDSYGLGLGGIRGWWGHTGNGLGYQAAVFSEPGTGSTVVILMNATNENPDVPAELFEKLLDTLGWPG